MTDQEDLDFLKGFRKTVRWTLFTTGGLIVLIGALGALNPVLPFFSPPSVIGIGLLFSALNYFVPHFALRHYPFRPKWLMILALVDAVFGALFLSRVGLLLFKLPALLGLWIVFMGCSRVYMAYSNFKSKVSCWWITLIVSGYSAISAAAMMANQSDSPSLPSWITVVGTGLLIISEGRKLFGK